MEAEKGQGQCTHSYPNTEWVTDATTTADRCMDTYRDLHGQIKGNAHTFTSLHEAYCMANIFNNIIHYSNTCILIDA